MSDDLTLPSLDEPYATALRESATWALAERTPIGVLATGSIVRGNPSGSSDLDLCVLHRPHRRQRVQRFFNGVPAEFFINPPEQVRRAFAANVAGGTPTDLHMFATGVAIYDPEGVLRELQQEARALLAAGPALAPHILPHTRYLTATRLEDAFDVAGGDPATASAFLHRAVEEAILYRYWRDNRWLPRPKERLSTLDTFDPALAGDYRRFYAAADLATRLALGRAIVEHAIGVTGFFASSSAEEELAF